MLQNASEAGQDKPNPSSPVVEQIIVPAAIPIKLTSNDIEIERKITLQRQFDNLTPKELNALVAKYIEFLGLLRSAGLNTSIKLPRIVFIGNSDEEKYRVIENVIGIADCLKPTGPNTETTPRFKAPIRFTLINDTKESVASITVDGKKIEGNGSLYTVLKETATLKEDDDKFKLSEKPVEVEIRGSKIASLVFVDLPWRAPESGKKSENDLILSRLLHKYLGQSWGLTVAIGGGSTQFADWPTLKLTSTFDKDLQRLYTVALDPPDGNDPLSIALGLQQSYPTMNREKMHYLWKEADADSTEKHSGDICNVAKCGHDEFIQGLQRKILQIWAAMKPDALRIIQEALDDLRSRLNGYKAFQESQETEETKFKIILSQAIPVFHNQIIFSPEDRDSSACMGSSLDLIRESILDPPTTPLPSPVSWSEIFSNYQMEISQLQTIPITVDWVAIKNAIEDLRSNGPGRKPISDLKRLLLKAQLDALQIPRTRLFGSVQDNWKESIKIGLDKKASLEPFSDFKAVVLEAAGTLLTEQFKIIKEVSGQIDSADETSGWKFDFLNENENSKSSIWVDLMKSDTAETAIELFKTKAEAGFIEICHMHAALQPRLIIDNLLTRPIVGKLVDLLNKSSSETVKKLITMSEKATDKITFLSEQIKKYEQLLAITIK